MPDKDQSSFSSVGRFLLGELKTRCARKKKYDRPEKADELYAKWKDDSSAVLQDSILQELYEMYLPHMRKLARGYRSVSTVCDEEDLLQSGILGIIAALKKYDERKAKDMKFSSYMLWWIKKAFQNTVGNKDTYVLVCRPDGALVKTMNYQAFWSQKKELAATGHIYLVKKRLSYMSDLLASDEQELPEAALSGIEYDYSTLYDEDELGSADGFPEINDRKEFDDEDKSDEGCNGHEVQENTVVKASSAPNENINLRFVDAAYQAFLSRNGTRQAFYNDTVKEIAKLFRKYGEAIVKMYGPDDDLPRKAVSVILRDSIRMSLDTYENGSIQPGITFSVYLAMTMREAVTKYQWF